MEIFKLFGKIVIDDNESIKKIQATEKSAESLSSKLNKGIGTAVKWGAGIAAAATAVGGAMLAATSKTAAYADEIDKLSERTGIGVENLQRWKFAAEQSGADINTLEMGVKTLSNTFQMAVNGSDKSIKAFNSLGLSIKDLQELSQEQVFSEIMNSLAEMPEGLERNALGNQLLGRSYSELLPLLNSGSIGMADLMNRADELGLVMGEDSVKANVLFQDSMDQIKDSFGALSRNLTNEMLPILQELLDWILDHMPEIQEFTANAFEVISFVVTNLYKIFKDNLLPVLRALYDWVRPYIPQIQAIIETAFKAIGFAIDAVAAPILTIIDLFQRAKAAADAFFNSAGSRPIVDDMSGQTVDLAGARANGGAVAAGKSYLVGEKGAEVFTPSTAGVIGSNQNTMASTGNITQNLYFTSRVDTPAEVARKVKQVNRSLALEWGLV